MRRLTRRKEPGKDPAKSNVMNSSIEFVQQDFSVGKQRFSECETSVAGSPEMLAPTGARWIKTNNLGLLIGPFNRNLGGQTEAPPHDLSGFPNTRGITSVSGTSGWDEA